MGEERPKKADRGSAAPQTKKRRVDAEAVDSELFLTGRERRVDGGLVKRGVLQFYE